MEKSKSKSIHPRGLRTVLFDLPEHGRIRRPLRILRRRRAERNGVLARRNDEHAGGEALVDTRLRGIGRKTAPCVQVRLVVPRLAYLGVVDNYVELYFESRISG